MTRESTPEFSSDEATAFDWFVYCVLLGVLISLGVNGASYLWRTGSLIDLVGTNQQVEESIGFPHIFWSEAALYHEPPVSIAGLKMYRRQVVEAIKYSALGWNLVYGMLFGAVLGVFAIISRNRFSRSIRHRAALRIAKENGKLSQGKGGPFQISMRALLLLMAVVALTAAVLSPAENIDLEPVESSFLAMLGYSSETQTLEVQLQSGAVYRYYEVPQSVYQELKSAGSLGRYYSSHIRDKYMYTNVLLLGRVVTLKVICFLGPAYLLTFAILLSRVRPRIRYTLTLLVGLAIVCFAMSHFVRLDRNQDRVLLGLFTCWTPQFALLAMAWFISFSVRAFLSNQSEPACGS